MGDLQRSLARMNRRWGPWLRTPVALLTMLAVGVVVLVTLVPGGRHQLALSVSRGPDSYLEVYFPPGTAGPRCGSTKRVAVRFWLVSHLRHPERVRYVVRAASTGAEGDPVTGRVALVPGERARVERTVTPPKTRRFQVDVRLPGRTEALSLQCRVSEGRQR